MVYTSTEKSFLISGGQLLCSLLLNLLEPLIFVDNKCYYDENRIFPIIPKKTRLTKLISSMYFYLKLLKGSVQRHI